MAYSDEQWDRAKAYFESGQYSLSQISDKTGIDKSQISRKSKIQQWQHGKNSDYIEAKTTLAIKKTTENTTVLQTLDDIADEAIRNKMLIFGVTHKALQKAKALLDEADNMNDINTAIQLADRASLTLGVNPHHASNQVNIQNNQSVEPTKIIREIIDVCPRD